MTLLIVFSSIGAYLAGALTTVYALLATELGEIPVRCKLCRQLVFSQEYDYHPCPICGHKQTFGRLECVSTERIFLASTFWPVGLPLSIVVYRAQLSRDRRNKRAFERSLVEQEEKRLLEEAGL